MTGPRLPIATPSAETKAQAQAFLEGIAAVYSLYGICFVCEPCYCPGDGFDVVSRLIATWETDEDPDVSFLCMKNDLSVEWARKKQEHPDIMAQVQLTKSAHSKLKAAKLVANMKAVAKGGAT